MNGPRIAVRHRGADGSVSDVVGHLVQDTLDRLVVLPDDGPPVTISPAQVAARRQIPDRPVRPSSSADRLQRLLCDTWPGLEQERLGGWVLRAGGVTPRDSSALASGDPGLPDDEAREVARRWYEARRLRPRLAVMGDATAPDGWTAVGEGTVLVGDLRAPSGAGGTGHPRSVGGHLVLEPDVPGPRPATPGHSGAAVAAGDDRGTGPQGRDASVDLVTSERPGPEWTALWRPEAAHDPHVQAVLTAAPAHYLTVLVDGVPTGCVRVAVTRRWGVLSCLTVAPEHRGHGWGQVLGAAALDAARAAGASWVAVQVESENAPCAPGYATLGLSLHHRYRYLEPAD